MGKQTTHRVVGKTFVAQPLVKSLNGVGQRAGIQPPQDFQLFGSQHGIHDSK